MPQRKASRKQPVAICRLKRVAADHKQDDVRDRCCRPKAATERNGKRVACVGAGPASLTVARDLAATRLRSRGVRFSDSQAPAA